MGVNWGISQPVDIGGAFSRAFEAGQAQQRQRASENALMRYAQDPSDPKAMDELARHDPRLAIQVRGQMQDQQRQLLEQHRENIVKGARIIREINPQDQAAWDRALMTAQQLGIDVSEVPRQFDPQYMQGIVAAADALAPEKEQAAPNFIRELEALGIDPRSPDAMRLYYARNSPAGFLIEPEGATQTAKGVIPPLPPGFVLDNDGGQPAPQAGGFPGN